MDPSSVEKPTDESPVPAPETPAKPEAAPNDASNTLKQTSKPERKRHSKKSHSKKSKKPRKNSCPTNDSGSSSSTSSDDEAESASDSDSSTSSDDSKSKRKSKKKRRAARKGGRSRNKSRRTRITDESGSDSESADSDESGESDSSSEDERSKRRRKNKRKARRPRRADDILEYDDDLSEHSVDDLDDENARLRQQLAALKMSGMQSRGAGRGRGRGLFRGFSSAAYGDGDLDKPLKLRTSKKKKKKAKRGSTMAFKRVDQLWDSSIHDYKLTESAEVQEDQFDEYVFTVRRRFDWENKYKNTVVDIKSKILRDALQEVMADVKGVSLVEDQPCVDPNMLFLYLEELRRYTKQTLKNKIKSEKKKKIQKRHKTMKNECKLLLSYLDEDYADTKKTLYPMLEAGNITFDLLWALFKPNTLAYTATYGSTEDPRCFKVDYATKESSLMRGEWYTIEGRYLEYDGKSFGLGDFEVDIDAFKGPRKITSLSTYPVKYHKDPDGLKKQLIERGKRFVALEGMNYRFHKGLAFMKKKRTVAKVNINGRIMIDPAIFRRINPNYPISVLKPKDADEDMQPGDSDGECSSCADKSDEEDGEGGNDEHAPRETKYKVVFDKEDRAHIIEVPIDADGREITFEKFDALPDGVDPKVKHEFSEEELLIASPVVLGFAFSEKLWLEFSLSGVRDIDWNEGAFESLVLPENQKSIVKALVESHKFHAAKTIDDVVQGKGKGLVAVLHGPPGTGKTLTAEGIAELLRCPLYMVSAGELGTDPRVLEAELQKILDIAHSWGAVLLLDEADVFLEKREVHDIHRNALVSIFLRLLEYFQGILFLTTNRVETFDDAFQSRIHVALRYGELTSKAKRAVWKMFLERVNAMEGVESVAWTEEDFEVLSRKPMNGRQIKNAVRTAQALAVNNAEKLSMDHIRRVLQVAESFEQDLKGGTGYVDAMRSYT